MNKKIQKISLLVVGCAVIAGSSFYAGLKYGQKNGQFGLNSNFSADNRQNRLGGQLGANMTGGLKGQGFAEGEILSKDRESLTIKLRDGGSKIILFSSATPITKSADGTADDLKVGENITISGTTNDDGSVSAKTIQLKPQMTAPENPQK